MRDDAPAAASDTSPASPDATVSVGDPATVELLRERDRLRVLAATAAPLERDVQTLRGELAAIDGSLSWRLTTPLREARALVANRRALALAAGRRVKRRLER